MNKVYNLGIAFLLPLLILAQQPFGKNATWVVEYQNEYGYDGFRQISYSHDTIIDGESWQKFSLAGVIHLKTGPNPEDVVQSKYSGLVYEKIFLTRNDSVFMMDIGVGVQSLLYDYSAQVGDKWEFAEWDSTYSCVDTPQVTVTAIVNSSLQGQGLTYWDLKNEEDSIFTPSGNWFGCSSSYCLGTKLYERIGIPQNNFEPYFNACSGIIVEYPFYTLRCFQDDSISVNFTNAACDAWAWLDVDEFSLSLDFKIYPNPNSTDYLEIESLNEFDNVSIVNISGRVILDMNVEADLKRTIALNLDGGLYFVQLKNNGKNLGVHKLIIQ